MCGGGSWSRVFSRIPDLREEEEEEGGWGESAGKGSLRGQGSELSRDPTTTNAALIFRLFFTVGPVKTKGES